MSKKITIMLIIPLIAATFLYASEKKDNIKPVKLVFFDIRDNYTQGMTSNKLRAGISMVLNTVLLGNKYVISLLQKKGQKSVCFSSSCAVKPGKILKADKVITGYITKTNEKDLVTHKKSGDKRSKTQIDNDSAYYLFLSITDVNTGNIDLIIKEKSSTPEMNNAIKNALEKIRIYFNGIKEKSNQECPKKKARVSPCNISMNIFGSRIFPHGAFKSMTTHGYGLKVKPEINNFIFSKSVFQFSASHYLYWSENNNINSFNSVELGILAGYSIDLTGKLRTIPLLGGGYNINIIEEDKGGKKFLSDPYLTAGLDISFCISGNWRLLISPSYIIFFEEENTGRYLSISAGIGFNF